MDPMTVDKRIVHRNIEKGQLTQKEYDKYRAALPDLTDECEEIEVSLYGTDEEEVVVPEEGEEVQTEETPEPEGQTEGL